MLRHTLSIAGMKKCMVSKNCAFTHYYSVYATCTPSLDVVLYGIMHALTIVSLLITTRITDLEQYAALEQQIREFGQIPDQLFTTPHPSKHVKVCITHLLQ